MTDATIDFTPVTDLVAGLLDGVDDARLADPTPCGHYTQAQLLNHLLGLCLAFTAAARGETGPHNDAPPGEPATALEPQWRGELQRRLATLADVWSAPSAWEGDALAGGVTLPASIMGLVALNEVAIHGWDLARATGQDYALDPGVVEALTAFTGQDAHDQSAREGIYGPVVTLPADAPRQDQLIALTGRDPAWRP
ncbi:TIGR03086 family metal-binding protein [Glycomyces luteolus]|uniref:TIGR03086 family metal-binding protein n=1 Tax=Glycomyces luteolus TaxID=2670330 RepID=A0A9X3T2L8_9ACTN|nr:TIGR03086 family metal-binding protein [Glycomyces luteolus]MDA1358915.1 TIGR03086 family metal-binding protein [Glycomyces luteolus]